MKIKQSLAMKIILIIAAVFLVWKFIYSYDAGFGGTDLGLVTSISQTSNNSQKDAESTYVDIGVKILSGRHKGQIVQVKDYVYEKTGSENIIHKGGEVLLNIEEDNSGNIKNTTIYEIARHKPLLMLIASFMILLIILGGVKGLKSIITLLLTAFSIIKILIPLIMKGLNPIPVTVFISIVIIVVNLTLVSGKNRKTLTAIIGTSGGLIIAAVIAYSMTYTLRLKGLTLEDIQTIISVTSNMKFNFSGLLFSAILLGALGAVMDVSISIASALWELIDRHPEISNKDLINSGINIGRDIMGSMSNTLILAYAAGSMYLLIIISSFNMGFIETINQDIIAAEILKALSGSIGLIFSIPITAVTAALLRKKTKGVS